MKLIVTLALALVPAFAWAHEGHDKTTKDDTTRKIESKNPDQMMTDARIASILHKVNKSEIEAGKLAEMQGQSPEVRDYGRMLTKDHTDADTNLVSIAKKAKIDLDTLNGPDQDMLKNDAKKMDQVKMMKGAEFDRAFGTAMYNGHDGVLKMLKDHDKDIKSAELRKFVDDVRPTLEHHKDMADKIQGKAPGAQGRAPEMPPRPFQQ